MSEASANVLAADAAVDSVPVPVLGIPFDRVTMGDAVERVARMVAERRPSQVVTANLDFAALAEEDLELRRIFSSADMVVCDGMPLVWLSCFMRQPLPERVAGSDMVPLLLQRAAREGWKVFFLGATPDVLRRAAGVVSARYPGVRLDCYSPAFAPVEEMRDAVERVKAAKPDLLLVALGCQKQEKWIARNLKELDVPVSIGVGASIDFLAGDVVRAPSVLQRLGLEWVFRMCQEPRRLFKRYFRDGCFFLRNLGGVSVFSGQLLNYARLRVGCQTGHFNCASCRLRVGCLSGVYDCSGFSVLGARELAHLIYWHRFYVRRGGRFRLLNVGAELSISIERQGFGDVFSLCYDRPVGGVF